MKLKIILGLMILFCGIFTVSAQEDSEKAKQHPIDKTLEECLKTNHATMPRAKCYSIASESWQKAVNEDYKLLLKQLSPELRVLLENEQNAWVKYKDAHEKFVMGKYGKRRGTGYIAVRIIELMNPYKDRALDLETRFQN